VICWAATIATKKPKHRHSLVTPNVTVERKAGNNEETAPEGHYWGEKRA
jgi:hypothetical protein